MRNLHRNVILTAVVGVALVAGAYALLGIGLAAIVAVALFVLFGIVLSGLIVFEEETRLPWWEDARDPNHDHGYRPAR